MHPAMQMRALLPFMRKEVPIDSEDNSWSVGEDRRLCHERSKGSSPILSHRDCKPSYA